MLVEAKVVSPDIAVQSAEVPVIGPLHPAIDMAIRIHELRSNPSLNPQEDTALFKKIRKLDKMLGVRGADQMLEAVGKLAGYEQILENLGGWNNSMVGAPNILPTFYQQLANDEAHYRAEAAKRVRVGRRIHRAIGRALPVAVIAGSLVASVGYGIQLPEVRHVLDPNTILMDRLDGLPSQDNMPLMYALSMLPGAGLVGFIGHRARKAGFARADAWNQLADLFAEFREVIQGKGNTREIMYSKRGILTLSANFDNLRAKRNDISYLCKAWGLDSSSHANLVDLNYQLSQLRKNPDAYTNLTRLAKDHPEIFRQQLLGWVSYISKVTGREFVAQEQDSNADLFALLIEHAMDAFEEPVLLDDFDQERRQQKVNIATAIAQLEFLQLLVQ